MITLLQNLASISDPNFLENLDSDTFEHPNVHIYWKDMQGKYLGSNSSLAIKTGYQQGSDLITATDYDLSWASYADIICGNDNQTIGHNNSSTTLEPFRSYDGVEENYYSFKSPLRTKDKKIIGVVGVSFKLDKNFLTNSILKLSDDDVILESDSKSEKINFDNLTHRQKRCLYYLIRGLSIKEIAKLQNLSPKTVEHYLEAIKLKLHCKSRSELITKATSQLILIPTL